MDHLLARRIPPHILPLVLSVAVMAVLPHLLHLPAAVTGYFLLILVLRLTSLRSTRLEPGRWLLILLTLGGILMVYSQHQTLFGRDAGVSLLCVMLGLKSMELRKRRDVYVVVFISYFVVITQFLFNQNFALTLYLLFVVISLSALLLELNRVTPARGILPPLLKTAGIILQALPIAAILFFLFPRLSQPLWQFDFGDRGMTGLSERMSPGAISQLIQSPEAAFRVRFLDQVPAAQARYWRALVLWDTDGFDWFNRAPVSTRPAGGLQGSGEAIAYEVFMEPHHRRWLYALDMPVSAPPGSRLMSDYTLLASQPVERTRQYQLISHTRYRTGQTASRQRRRALTLPENITHRERELVSTWRGQSRSDSALVRRALRYFNTRPFIYTLNPPRYRDNPSDQFLFEGRAGFCEHYASSFTLLMRLAGIPARVVIGYQGGEYNPLGDYYLVRQADAHAWSEVWLPQQGWVRIDPTAAVAPERVRYSIQAELAQQGAPVRFRLEEGGVLKSALQQLGFTLDAARTGWRRWVLGYSRERQASLMQALGLDRLAPRGWLLISLGGIGLLLLLILLHLLLQDRTRRDPILAGYETFCARLARAGLPRRPSEGPLDYSRRVARRWPELKGQTERLIHEYIDLRYGAGASHQRVHAFLAQVRRFRPSKTSKSAG